MRYINRRFTYLLTYPSASAFSACIVHSISYRTLA